MPISETDRTTNRCHQRNCRYLLNSTPRLTAGFTLIEILVVVTVIGILVSIFTLSVGGFLEEPGREDIRRLDTLLKLANEEASIQGRELGLTFYQHGYEFSQRETLTDEDGLRYQQWEVLQADRLLRARDLGNDLTVDLSLDGEEVTLLYERDSDAEYEPQIFLLSSGDIEPPFTVRLRSSFETQGRVIEVAIDGSTKVIVEGVDDAD